MPSVSFAPPATCYSPTQTSIEIDSLREAPTSTSPSLVAAPKELCQDLFHDTLELIKKVFRDSKTDKANFHETFRLGSGLHSHPSYIVKLVSDFFNGKGPNKNINPNETVAYGAVPSSQLLLDPGGGTFDGASPDTNQCPSPN